MPSIVINNSPIYRTCGAVEIDGNPLIAHLNLPPESDTEAFLSLGLRLDFDVREREMPAAIRRLRINRLRRFFAPTSVAHRRALTGISSQLFDGYIARNPLTPEGQKILYGQTINPSHRPTISLIAGHSGMGKSTLIDRILLSMGNQDYQHTSFGQINFPERQILWLRRNVPEHCTVRTLCSSFGDYADSILGLSLYQGIFSRLKGADRNLYLAEIRKIITNHHVGLLVLDEFQNLSLMGVGAEKIISFLVNLRDELGLPIVIAGTYKALRLLEGNMSTARRLVEGGYYDLERPKNSDDVSWAQLCEIAWSYQWVREPIEFSSSICNALYETSQGITGIMLSVFVTAQLEAIESGIEKVDERLILKVFAERMTPLHPAIKMLKSGSPLMLDKFDDLYQNFYPNGKVINELNITKIERETTDTAIKSKSKISDTSTSLSKKPNPTKKISEDEIKEQVLASRITNLSTVFDT